MTELINTLTERLEKYMDDITDCCGDYCLFADLNARNRRVAFRIKEAC